jgi:hypothetical protein
MERARNASRSPGHAEFLLRRAERIKHPLEAEEAVEQKKK